MGNEPRELIAAKIKADNPTYAVSNFPVTGPEHLPANKVFVSVFREFLNNDPQLLSVTHSLKIHLITPKKDTEIAERELEAALDAVLMSIAPLNYVQWSTAERSTFLEKFIGYEIILEARTENIYKP